MAIHPVAFKMGPSCHAAVSLSSYLLCWPAALYERPSDRVAPRMVMRAPFEARVRLKRNAVPTKASE
ncbi:hypothetical protein [Bradyrhizobium sp. USDA 4369]